MQVYFFKLHLKIHHAILDPQRYSSVAFSPFFRLRILFKNRYKTKPCQLILTRFLYINACNLIHNVLYPMWNLRNCESLVMYLRNGAFFYDRGWFSLFHLKLNALKPCQLSWHGFCFAMHDCCILIQKYTNVSLLHKTYQNTSC